MLLSLFLTNLGMGATSSAAPVSTQVLEYSLPFPILVGLTMTRRHRRRSKKQFWEFL